MTDQPSAPSADEQTRRPKSHVGHLVEDNGDRIFAAFYLAYEAEAELTRLRAELQETKDDSASPGPTPATSALLSSVPNEGDSGQFNTPLVYGLTEMLRTLKATDVRYTSLLIDLRALVEQWRALAATTRPIVIYSLIDALAARLDKEQP